MKQLHRAARVMPLVQMGASLEDGAILLNNGIIVQVGPFSELGAENDVEVVDHGDATLVPGLINAHCHLELSHLAGQTLSGVGFVEWVENLLSLPLMDPDPDAVRIACEALKSSGTTMVGDIATRFPEQVASIMESAGLSFVSFREAIGESVPASAIPEATYASGRHSASGHSLYTTHKDLLKAAKTETASLGLPFSLHLSEHEDELNIMLGNHSEFLDMLQSRGRLLDFKPPGMRPVQYADALGLLDEQTLAVHCVHLDDADVSVLSRSGATVCLCPRSNEFIGVGRAPWERLRKAGVPLCLGTDSIASNHDLNLWNEAVFLKEQWEGDLSLEDAVAMMTRVPARILGADHLGTLEPGKAAVFTEVPQGVLDAFC